jgi:hypothetical protein
VNDLVCVASQLRPWALHLARVGKIRYMMFTANERRCWMDSIPKWVRYGVGVIVTIFVAIAIWYMIQP